MDTADARRTVNIAINVIGNAGTKFKEVAAGLKALGTHFDKIATNISPVSTGLTNIANSLGSIQGNIPDLSDFTKQVRSLSKIDSEQLTAFVESAKGLKDLKVSSSFTTLADGLKTISSVGKFPDVSKLSTSISELKAATKGMQITQLGKLAETLAVFKGTKIPTGTNLTKFANGLKDLQSADLKGVNTAKLIALSTALKGFSDISGLPSAAKWVGFSQGLKKLGEVTGLTSTKINNLENLAKALPKFVGVSKGLPTANRLIDFSTGLKALKGITFPNFGKMIGLSAALRSFMGIKGLPASGLTNFAKAIGGFKGIDTTGMKKLAADIDVLVASLAKLVALSPDLSILRNLASASARAATAVKNVGSAASTAGTQMGGSAAGANQAAQGIQNLSSAASASSKHLKKLGQSIANYTKYRLIADTIIAMKEAMFAGVTAIIDYDQALKDLQAITGATALEVEQMGEKILDVASRTKFSASEVAEGMRTLGQAGFSAGESVQAMQAVSNLATGTLSTMASTVDLVTTALRVFRLDVSESTRVSDIFGNAVNRSKLTIDKLRISMNYVGPIARDVGVSLEEMSAAMMTLANSGLRASTIGTGLRRVFAELADPSDKLAAAAANVGVALSDINPEANDLSTVIRNLGLVIHDTRLAFEIFGKRGAAAALALSSEGSSFENMLSTVSQSGTAAHMASIQMEGLGVSLKNLRDRAGVLAIKFGEGGLTKVFKVLIDVGRVALEVITKLVDTPVGKLVVQLGLLTVAVGTLTAAILILKDVGLIAYFAKIGTAVLTLASDLGVATYAALGLSGVLTGLAVGTGLIALVAVIAGVVYGFESMTESAQKASDEASKLADAYGQYAKTVVDYKIAIASLEDGSKEQLSQNLKLRASLATVAEGNSKLADSALKAMGSINALNGKMAEGSTAVEEYYAKAKELADLKFAESFKEGFEALKQQTGILQAVQDMFGTMVTIAIQTGKDMLDGLFGDDWWHVLSSIPGLMLLAFKKGWANLKKFIKGEVEGDLIAWDLSKGKKSWEDFAKDVAEIQKKLPENRSDRENTLVKQFEERTANATKALEKMGKEGVNASDTTVEGMLSVAKSMKLITDESEIAAHALVYQFKKLQKDSNFTGLLGKWAEDEEKYKEKTKKNILELIGLYESMGGKASEDDKTEAASLRAEKKKLLQDRKDLDAARDAELGKGGADESAILKKYYEERNKLENDAAKVQAKIKYNEAIQAGAALERAGKERDKALAENKERFKESTKDLERHAAKIRDEFAKTTGKVLETTVDAESIVKSSKKVRDATKAALDASLYDIEELEATGVMSHEAAEEAKLQITLDSYKKQEEIAKSTFAALKKAREEDGLQVENEMYDKAEKAATAASEERIKANLKLLQYYGNEVEKVQNKLATSESKRVKSIADSAAKIKNISEKTDKARLDSNTKYNEAAKKLEEDLFKSILSINRKLREDLKKFDEDRLDANKTRLNSLSDLELSIEDKKASIRQKGMTDEQKQSDDRRRANNKYLEAVKLINEAIKTGDEDTLKRGEKLLDQSADLYSNDKSTNAAIANLDRIAAKKKEVIAAQYQIDLVQIKKEEDARKKKADDDIQTAKNLAATKQMIADEDHVKDLIKIDEKFKEEIKAEDERHRIALAHIDIEILQFKKLVAEIQKLRDKVLKDKKDAEGESSKEPPPEKNPVGEIPPKEAPRKETPRKETPLAESVKRTLEDVITPSKNPADVPTFTQEPAETNASTDALIKHAEAIQKIKDKTLEVGYAALTASEKIDEMAARLNLVREEGESDESLSKRVFETPPNLEANIIDPYKKVVKEIAANPIKSTVVVDMVASPSRPFTEGVKYLKDSLKGVSDTKIEATVNVNTDEVTKTRKEVDRIAESINLARKAGESDADLAKRISNTWSIDDDIAKVKELKKETKSGAEIALKVANTKEVDEAIARIKKQKEDIAKGIDTSQLKRNLAKDIDIEVNVKTEKAIKHIDSIRKQVAEMKLGGDGIFTLEEQERSEKLVENVSAFFSQMENPEGVQRLQDMITVAEALQKKHGKISDGMMQDIRDYANTLDGVNLVEDMLGDGKVDLQIFDDVGDRYKGLTEEMKSNPFRIFPEKYGEEILSGMNNIPGLVRAISDRANREVMEALKKSKAEADAIMTDEKDGSPVQIPAEIDIKNREKIQTWFEDEEALDMPVMVKLTDDEVNAILAETEAAIAEMNAEIPAKVVLDETSRDDIQTWFEDDEGIDIPVDVTASSDMLDETAAEMNSKLRNAFSLPVDILAAPFEFVKQRIAEIHTALEELPEGRKIPIIPTFKEGDINNLVKSAEDVLSAPFTFLKTRLSEVKTAIGEVAVEIGLRLKESAPAEILAAPFEFVKQRIAEIKTAFDELPEGREIPIIPTFEKGDISNLVKSAEDVLSAPFTFLKTRLSEIATEMGLKLKESAPVGVPVKFTVDEDSQEELQTWFKNDNNDLTKNINVTLTASPTVPFSEGIKNINDKFAEIENKKVVIDFVGEFNLPEGIDLKGASMFNTLLTPEEMVKFEAWIKEASAVTGRTIIADIENYDLAGYWRDEVSTGIEQGLEKGLHGPDTYKKPSHPTFSDESKYSTDEFEGGSWAEGDKFTPSQDQLEAGWAVHFPQEYFDAIKSGVTVVMPQVQSLGELIASTFSVMVNKAVEITMKVSQFDLWETALVTYNALEDKDVTITTHYETTGTPPGGGASSESTSEGSTGGTDVPQGMAGGGGVFPRLTQAMITRGSGFKDDVRALLMKGEYVLKQSAVTKIIKNVGPAFLDKLNRGVIDVTKLVPNFEFGGPVGVDFGSSLNGLNGIMSSMALGSSIPQTSPATNNSNVVNTSNWSVTIGDGAFAPRGNIESLSKRLLDDVRRNY